MDVWYSYKSPQTNQFVTLKIRRILGPISKLMIRRLKWTNSCLIRRVFVCSVVYCCFSSPIGGAYMYTILCTLWVFQAHRGKN